jgi:hypothetical protein
LHTEKNEPTVSGGGDKRWLFFNSELFCRRA